MPNSRIKRRLTAILAADVVGYSHLMGKDEAGTLARLKSLHKNLVHPTISDSNGRIVKLMGDGLLAEFSSVVDAVQCALHIQQSIVKRETELDNNQRIRLRIGVNLGDIIVEGSDIYGDGVNIAARLEGLAEPGGICVSAKVYEEVKNKLSISFKDMGAQAVKNIQEPIRVYSWTINGSSTGSVGPKAGLPLSDKPSIAVLPFSNMSGDPEREFFADGIAEDIITALSRFHDLLVISRNSSFVYRGTSVDMRQVGRELNVQYVLEGSVRTSSNRVRITAQLIEAHSGNHVWAERFDRSLEDVFEVQDEITALVASTVSQQMSVAEYRNAISHAEQDLDYRGLYYQGMWYMNKVTAEGCIKAREYAEQTLDRYPRHVGGYSLMAYVNIIEFIYGWGEDRRAQMIHDAAQYATKAIRIDPDDEMSHTMLGAVCWMSGKHDDAINECETVLRRNPNFAYAYGILGIVHAYSGSKYYQQAVECLDRAIGLSPNDPWLQFLFAHRGTAEFFNQNFDAAIDWYHRSIQRNPDLPTAHRFLAATLALKGEMEKSRHSIANVLRTEPNCSRSNLRQRLSQAFRHDEDFDFYIRGLQLAGLPEE